MGPRIALAVRMLIASIGGAVVGFTAITWLNRPAEARLVLAPVGGQTQAVGRVFSSDAAIMVKYIKADKTADFEATIARVKDALERSDSPERRRQAATWKIFRAVESATNGDAVYVFLIDPAVKNANYAISGILAEAFPAEAPSLYGRYLDSYSSGQNIVDLRLIASLGADAVR